MLLFETDKANLVFVHVPKTAGGSLTKYLIRRLKEEKKKGNLEIRRLHELWEKGGFIVTMHLPVYCNYQKFLGNDDGFLKVACVRNPYDRVFSAYQWENSWNPQHITFTEFVQTKLPIIVQRGITAFEKKQLLPRDQIVLYPMWIFLLKSDKSLGVDKIIRHESLETGIEDLCKSIELPYEPMTENWHKGNWSKIGMYSYLHEYSLETLKLIEELYALDFEHFIYPKLSKLGNLEEYGIQS